MLPLQFFHAAVAPAARRGWLLASGRLVGMTMRCLRGTRGWGHPHSKSRPFVDRVLPKPDSRYTGSTMIGVLYEHPEWFEPLFAELDRRGLPVSRIPAERVCFDPAAAASPYQLVFNRMSPSAYLRGHARAIF